MVNHCHKEIIKGSKNGNSKDVGHFLIQKQASKACPKKIIKHIANGRKACCHVASVILSSLERCPKHVFFTKSSKSQWVNGLSGNNFNCYFTQEMLHDIIKNALIIQAALGLFD